MKVLKLKPRASKVFHQSQHQIRVDERRNRWVCIAELIFSQTAEATHSYNKCMKRLKIQIFGKLSQENLFNSNQTFYSSDDLFELTFLCAHFYFLLWKFKSCLLRNHPSRLILNFIPLCLDLNANIMNSFQRLTYSKTLRG